MRRLTGIILMATVAYAGHLGINHFFTDNFEEKQAFSNLRTKLQKTLVMVDNSSPSKAVEGKKTIQTIKKKSSSLRAVPASKTDLINNMKSTYDSLAEVSHIFRHEVSEMISIIEKSAPMKSLNPKITYAKNWSAYIRNNVKKFNMSQDNKTRVSNMVVQMQSYISGLTTTSTNNAVVEPVVARTIKPVEVKKVVMAKTTTPVVEKIEPVVISQPVTTGDAAESLVTKSITESLVALKQWEQSRKKANTIVESFSTIWLAVVGFFALIALWMSKDKSEEKLVVTEVESKVEPSDKTSEMALEKTDEGTIAVVDETQFDEEVEAIEANYFFDEISNSLSTLCQAKGIILDTDELEGCSELVEKFQLTEVEQEIEDFTKTIIRSLGKEGTKNVRLHFIEKSTKLKMVATVTSESSLDINMTRIASGFRDLEEKLSSRKGVFNIEQSVSGNDIDFVMQLTADDNREMNNVEQVEIVAPTV